MSKRPNIIVFFTDQQRHDSTGVHGNPLDLTPNFDAMARRGTDVHQSITCQPVCGPARTALQTGMYQNTTGCFRNDIIPQPGTRMLGHEFRDAGYDTGYIGKWHLGDPKVHGPVRESERGGYDYWLGSNVLEFTSDAYHTSLYDNDGKEVRLPGYRVDAVTDAAIRYIDSHANGEKPFFLFVSYIEPHHQNHMDSYPAPDGYRQRYTGRWTPPDLAAIVSERTGQVGGTAQQHLGGYWGMIKRLDEALGRYFDALKSLGIDHDTIVLYTSDHACHFKTRNAEYKRSCHESSVRVPTAICGPGFDGGGRIDRPVSLIDLPATLLDAAGIDVPQRMQGHSILPLLHGAVPADYPDEVFIQISESQVGRAIRTSRWKYSVTAPNLSGSAVGGSDHYVETFLYDLSNDPYELANLIGLKSHAAVTELMRQRLIRRMTEAGESAPTIEPAPQSPAGHRHVTEAEARM